MATLTLTKVFINRLDTGVAVSGQSGPGRSQSYDMDGNVRTFAGGRMRAISTDGERGQFPFTLRDVTQATVDTLRSWLAYGVQVRDHRGRRFYGVILSVVVTEMPEPTLYDATVVLQTITAPDGV